MKRRTWSALLPLVLLGCSGTSMPPVDPVDTVLDVESYELVGHYDWLQDRLIATITITGISSNDALVLDSSVDRINAVRARSTALPFEQDAEEGTLTIDLEPADRGDASFTISIDYEAVPGTVPGAEDSNDVLAVVRARPGDPVSSRVVFTYAEPNGAHGYMPCHESVEDRATFAIELTVDDGETAVSNGVLVSDTPDPAGGHRVRYETSYTLPTYLMAFAAGELVAEPTGHAGAANVPITIWHRRGLTADFASVQTTIDDALQRFEMLLGVPYPYERYDLVLLPDFVGGEEHASATFQEELTVGTHFDDDLDLMAHELAHQWFGDSVSIATWDDLWVKEGLATLLAAEFTRTWHDRSNAGVLRGDVFEAVAGEAARDAMLEPEDKFTSGPYDRGAWLYTQVRALVGEQAFWSTLGTIATAYRDKTITSDQVIDAFRPTLGDANADQWRAALDARSLPTIRATAVGTAGVSILIADPEGTMLVPLELLWFAANGATTSVTVEPGTATTIFPPSADALLVIDPRDVHPRIEDLFASTNDAAVFAARLGDRRLPSTTAQVATFLQLPGPHQTAALDELGLPPAVTAASFQSFLDRLLDEDARALAVDAACEVATTTAWKATLVPILKQPPNYAGLDAVDDYSACTHVAEPASLFAADYAALASDQLPIERVAYVALFPLDDSDALATWSGVIDNSRSRRIREVAAAALAYQADEVEATALPAWRAGLAALVGATAAPNVLSELLDAVVDTAATSAANNDAALGAIKTVLGTYAAHQAHPQAVCTAHALVGTDTAAWQALIASLGMAKLDAQTRELLADPSDCTDETAPTVPTARWPRGRAGAVARRRP